MEEKQAYPSKKAQKDSNNVIGYSKTKNIIASFHFLHKLSPVFDISLFHSFR